MRLYALLLLVFTLLLAGCPKPPQDTGSTDGANGTTATPARSDYRFPLPGQITTLDPVMITDTVSDTVAHRIYSTLLKFGMDGSPSPDLAESYDVSEDGLVYTMHIRPDARFHNGEACNAEDVIYSFTRLLSPATASPRADWLGLVKGAREFNAGTADTIPGLEMVDEQTLRLTLNEPFSPFPMILCMTNLSIVPKSEIDKNPDGFGDNPVGSGPFVCREFVRGERVTLKANKDYFGTKPQIETLVFRIIEDETTRFELFKNGELEHCDLKPSKVQEVMGDPKLKAMIVGEPAQDMYALGFNCEQPPFKDNTSLRLAFNHAIDKQNIVSNVWSGLVSPQTTYVPAGMFYYWNDSPGYPHDVEKARSLLAEAGYPEGKDLPEIVLTVDTEATNRRVAEAVQHDLEQIGVKVRIETIQKSELIQKNDDGELLFFQNTWLGDYPDPDNWLWQLLDSGNFGAKGNHARWANSEFDQYVRRARVELDPAVRGELYGKAEKLAHDEAPWLPLIWKNSSTLVQPWVKGLVISKTDRTPELNHAPLEEVRLED